MKKINPSIKHHLLIGIFICFWFFIFAYFIKPFDDGTIISSKQWILISIGFSLIAFLCYGLIAVIQKSFYQKVLKWNILFEIIILLLFHLLFLVMTYLYYKCPLLEVLLKKTFLKTVGCCANVSDFAPTPIGNKHNFLQIR